MEAPDLISIKQLIKNALEECTDLDVLDLVYKLLIFDNT